MGPGAGNTERARKDSWPESGRRREKALRETRSHINFCVYDGTWEASEAFAHDHAPEVAAWAKNDHQRRTHRPGTT